MKSRPRSLKETALVFAILQASEYVLPLIAIPYLIRVLGISGYGQLAFAQAICSYCLIFTEYGFNFTASREAALLQKDRAQLSKLFCNVQAARLILFLISAGVVALLTFFQPIRTIGNVLFFALLPALGTALYPLWFLQGIERTKDCIAIVVIVRVLFLLLIFLLVKKEMDKGLAAVLLFGATPLAGMLVLARISMWKLLDFHMPSLKAVIDTLVNARHAFFATIGSSFYRSTNAAVLGLVSTTEHVAYYSVAEKMVRVVQEINRPIALATYPRLSEKFKVDPRSARALLKQLTWLLGGIGVLASIALFVLSPILVQVVMAAPNPGAIAVVRVISLAPIIGSLNLVFGAQTMHPMGLSKEFSRLVWVSAIVSVILIVPLTMSFTSVGAALCYVISEGTLLANLIYFHRKNSLIWK